MGYARLDLDLERLDSVSHIPLKVAITAAGRENLNDVIKTLVNNLKDDFNHIGKPVYVVFVGKVA